MLGNGGNSPLSNRTMLGVRALSRALPSAPGRVAKKKGVVEEKIDRVDRDDGRSALFDYVDPDDETERPVLTQPAGHASALRSFTDDAFKGRPVFADVDQGNLGDAWLLAAFAAVAHVEPDAIIQRFRRCDETTWAITVAQETIIVTADFPTEGYADPSPNGQRDTLWVALLEKAFALRDAGSYVHLELGNPGRALEGLLGRQALKTSVNAHTPVTEILTRAREERRAVVLHTADARVSGPLHPDHCYALLEVSQGIAKIYNPWGTNGGQKSLTSLVHELDVDVLRADVDAIWRA